MEEMSEILRWGYGKKTQEWLQRKKVLSEMEQDLVSRFNQSFQNKEEDQSVFQSSKSLIFVPNANLRQSMHKAKAKQAANKEVNFLEGLDVKQVED